MNLVEQWDGIQAQLPEDWAQAALLLSAGDPPSAARVAALLGPANPGRSDRRVRFEVTRSGVGMRPDSLRRLLRKIDADEIDGTLEVVRTREAAPKAVRVEPEHGPLAQAWQEALDGLPEDWSDLYCEIELDSTDFLEPAALRLAPVNPARAGDGPVFRFRCARRFGYGASPGMVKRCFERLDESAITGETRILRALSDTKPVGTQGPVWYVAGKSV